MPIWELTIAVPPIGVNGLDRYWPERLARLPAYRTHEAARVGARAGEHELVVRSRSRAARGYIELKPFGHPLEGWITTTAFRHREQEGAP